MDKYELLVMVSVSFSFNLNNTIENHQRFPLKLGSNHLRVSYSMCH